MGDKLELTLNGPLRNNGADKLPSLDWKIAFSGLATKFTSRIVSTGDNFFINLGGQDFEAGEEAVQQLTDQARASQQKGLAQVGLNPLAAVRDVKAAGDRTFDGETLKVYKGAIDVDAVMDQIERLSQGLPTTGAAQTIPAGRLTPQQRAQVKRTFGSPRFEAAWPTTTPSASSLVTSKFTTPAANREAAAGGITGGRMEYRLEYTDVGEETTITPPKDPQPISDFARRSSGSSPKPRLVAHARQVEPVRRRGAARLRARAALEQPREGLQAAAAVGDLEHRPHQDAVHVAHERVGLDVELEHVAGALPARRRARRARSAGGRCRRA